MTVDPICKGVTIPSDDISAIVESEILHPKFKGGADELKVKLFGPRGSKIS